MEASLVWTTIGDADIPVFRRDVVLWADELDLSRAFLKRSGVVAAFRNAALKTEVTFEQGGVPYVLRGFAEKETPDFLLFNVNALCEQEAPMKYAQVKMYLPRRTAKGIVQGSHSWMPTIRRILSDEGREAAELWVKRFEHTWENSNHVLQVSELRKLVRATLLEASAFPLPSLRASYFIYDHYIDVVDRLNEFFGRLKCDGVVQVIGLRDRPQDADVVADAADLWEVSRIDGTLARLREWKRGPGPHQAGRSSPGSKEFRAFAQELGAHADRVKDHDTRTGIRLVRCHAALSAAANELYGG